MNSTVKGVLIVAGLVGALTVLRFKPWEGAGNTDAGVVSRATTTEDGRKRLVVGFLPVT